MDKQFFILIGRSGSGKGTQSKLLEKALIEKGVSKVLNLATGAVFRELIKGESFTAKTSHHINDVGGLQPEFLAVWSWADSFIKMIQGDETVILDGSPRKPFEAEILHSAITFFGYEKPIVIYVDTSESVARAHGIGRGREDDKNKEALSNRLDWFETGVLPTLNFYLNDPRYTVLHINGNQTIEEVHNEIMGKLKISN